MKELEVESSAQVIAIFVWVFIMRVSRNILNYMPGKKANKHAKKTCRRMSSTAKMNTESYSSILARYK